MRVWTFRRWNNKALFKEMISINNEYKLHARIDKWTNRQVVSMDGGESSSSPVALGRRARRRHARELVDIMNILYTLDSASLLVELKPRIFQRLPPFE
jgi:hypothetical protein